jgi:hypothetical protein
MRCESANGEKGRAPAKSGVRLGLLIFVGLGALLFLLPGCGSDSNTKGAASGKKEKSAKSDTTMRTITPLLSDKGGADSPLPRVDSLPGLGSPEEIEARRKAAEQAMLDPKLEVLPGLTLEQYEAKKEAARASFDPKREILPGLSHEQVEAKMREALKNPPQKELFSGLTEEQFKAKAAQAKQLQDAKSVRPEQMFPPK